MLSTYQASLFPPRLLKTAALLLLILMSETKAYIDTMQAYW